MTRVPLPALLAVAFAALAAPAAVPAAASEARGRAMADRWSHELARELADLDRRTPPGAWIAAYVKDLSTGEEVSWRGHETCYLASGVKIPIAIEVLRHVERGGLRLRDTLRVRPGDLIDGSPRSAARPPGSRVTVRELLEDMVTYSDNTASDVLIRQVGLASVNACVREVVPEGFGEVTTLADVRRLAYACAFPDAGGLDVRELAALRDVREQDARLRRLAELLHADPGDACFASLDEAFDDYYATGLNSATLVAYGQLLERLARGEALGPWGTAYLLHVMQRTRTGTQRVRAGLPRTIAWAHKTGTQHARVGDFGLAWHRDRPERIVVVVAVASGYEHLPEAEAALRDLGTAVAASGVLDPEEAGS